MKNQFTKTALSGGLWLLAAAGLTLQSTSANAQVQNYVRDYATRAVTNNPTTGLLSPTVDAPANIADGDPSTYATMSATLNLGSLLSPSVYLDFNTASATTGMSTHIPAGTPITVKVTLPAGVASVIGGVSVQPVINIHDAGPLTGWTATDVGTATVKSSLLGLLSGNGSFYITVKPTGAYDGVKVSMSGVSAVAAMQAFDAFKIDTVTTDVDCGAPIDILAGSNTTLNLANGISGVLNPWNAIDGDTSHYATMSVAVNAASNLYLQPVFSQPAKAGDSVRIVMRSPGNSGLLSLGLLGSFSIVPYMDDSARTAITSSSSLLNLRLLYPAEDKTVVSVPVNSTFNSVQVQINSLVGALSDYYIYDISHVIPAPQMTAAQKDIYVYAGQSATLGATTTNGDNVVWYTDSTRTTTTGSTVTTTSAQAGTTLHFYAAAERNGCTDASDLDKNNIHVMGFTGSQPDSGFVSVVYNSSVAITPSNPAGFPSVPAFKYTISSGSVPGLALNQSTGHLDGTPTQQGSFPITVDIQDTANNIPVGTFNYNIVIHASPLPVSWSYFRAASSANHTATLNWQTLEEKANSYFEIQRSQDAKSYKTIGRVDSRDGNAVKAQNYSYVDQDVTANTVYYRLRQVDVNGNYSYSSVATVQFTDAAAGNVLSITPNPGHDMISLQINASAHAVRVIVFDISGRIVYQAPVEEASLQIPAESGTYYVRLFDAKGQVLATQKAIVK
ncbi:MAG TPA: T9SS type A sorting domain-containing protein [Edaphocola sp.]|nr:T9SS type A sorting domain-containing protein [Edaphocola sp.]